MSTNNASTKKAPSHAVYHVRDIGQGENKKSFWTRVGSAWAHADGQGFNVQIEIVPLDGRLTLRVPDEKDAK